MKRILLTAIAVTALISFANAQAATGMKGATGLRINTTGLKPKSTTSTKSSTTTTGSTTTTTPKGGMPTGGGTSTTGTKPSSTTSSGKPDMGGSGSTTTTPPSSTTSSGKPDMGGGAGSTGSTTPSSGGNVNSSDAAAAVKQLLTAGITAAVTKVATTNGYFGNPEIKIPLPTQLQQVGSLLTTYGAGYLVDQLVTQLNRSAEQSAPLATPIFLNSLTQITPNDAVNIITGSQQDAATQFLKRTTTEQLVIAFKPKVKTVLDQTKTSEAYASVMNLYNKIPFVSHVDADLPDYVTRKALDGLFIMVGKEEAKIRQNPAAAGSSILSSVLGALGMKGVKAQGVSSTKTTTSTTTTKTKY